MAGFLERVARGAELRATSGLANPGLWLSEAFGGRASYSGKRVTVENAFGLSAVYAAVTLISETIGMLPFKVYREVDDQPVEAVAHRAWRMIHDKPNSVTPAQRFWATVAQHLLTHGNAFLPFARGADGLVEELWLEPPAGMTIRWDSRTRTKAFRKDTAEGPKTWSADDLLHIMGPSRDGLVGMSPIQECRDALGTSMARDEFEGAFYKRGATLSGWIEYPGQLTEQGNKNLSSSWTRKYEGSGKAGGTPILEEGAQFHTVQSPLADLQFVESKQLSRTEVAIIYHIPPDFLGGGSGDPLKYSTVESNKIQFSDFAVAPVAMTIAKAVSAHPAIFPQQNVFYAEHVFEGLLRADAKTRGEFYRLLYDLDAISDEEIRAKENMGPKADAPGEFKTDAAGTPASEPSENGGGRIETPEQLLETLSG